MLVKERKKKGEILSRQLEVPAAFASATQKS